MPRCFLAKQCNSKGYRPPDPDNRKWNSNEGIINQRNHTYIQSHHHIKRPGISVLLQNEKVPLTTLKAERSKSQKCKFVKSLLWSNIPLFLQVEPRAHNNVVIFQIPPLQYEIICLSQIERKPRPVLQIIRTVECPYRTYHCVPLPVSIILIVTANKRHDGKGVRG